jgi:hypothetical protein
MREIFVNGIHDYDIKEVGEDTVLSRSYGGNWQDHVKGKEVLRITDDGNGVDIRFEDLSLDLLRLDYSQREELLILLKLTASDSIHEVGTKKKF